MQGLIPSKHEAYFDITSALVSKRGSFKNMADDLLQWSEDRGKEKKFKLPF